MRRRNENSLKMSIVSFAGTTFDFKPVLRDGTGWVYAEPIMGYLKLPPAAVVVYCHRSNIAWNYELLRDPALSQKARFINKTGFLEIMRFSPREAEFRIWMLNEVFGAIERGSAPKSKPASFLQRCILWIKNRNK